MITAKAVIFDLDCTLVDTLGRFFKLFNEMLKERKKTPLSWDKFYEIYVTDTLDYAVAALSEGERNRRLHKFWMEFLRRYREGDPEATIIPGVKETLGELSAKGIPIAVVTSCVVPPAKLKKELDEFRLGKFVKVIATAHDVVKDLESGDHFSKVEIMSLAAERLGVRGQDCVVVGDYWNDLRDGKKIGARTVAVLTGHMRRELLQRFKPDAIIESVRNLTKVVKFGP